MPDTKILTRKPTDVLKQDHERVMELFERYEDLDDRAHARKQELFEKIKDALTVHATIEEEFFYPAVDDIDDADAEDLVTEAHEEHKIVKQLLEEISSLTPEDEEFDAKITVLCDTVKHHVEEEEKEIFPLVSQLSKEERNALAVRLSDRKRELESK